MTLLARLNGAGNACEADLARVDGAFPQKQGPFHRAGELQDMRVVGILRKSRNGAKNKAIRELH